MTARIPLSTSTLSCVGVHSDGMVVAGVGVGGAETGGGAAGNDNSFMSLLVLFPAAGIICSYIHSQKQEQLDLEFECTINRKDSHPH